MADNLPPGCTLDDINDPPQVCTSCQLEGDELYEVGDDWLCQGCYANRKIELWFKHIDRLNAFLNRLALSGCPPLWYDPESFEGRLLELEEEIK